jgi:hypothetical protein
VDDDSGVYDSVLRFDIPDISFQDVESATLRLFCTDGSDSGGIFGKTSANWDESSVTWNNAPSAYGAPIHSLGPVQMKIWYEVDVISLFTLGGYLNAVSFRISSNSWNRASYDSKEGEHPPQLVIQLKDEGVNDMNIQSKPIIPYGSEVGHSTGSTSGNGLFFPVWGTGGTVGCYDGVAPSWARGAYLKETKSDCCKAFFMLQVDECLNA